jgi:hypothetical protein
MSNCSNHRRDVHGETDMKHLAEEVGNLHYETLQNFLVYLCTKLYRDGLKDRMAGREKLGYALTDASDKVKEAAGHIKEAWQISKPFMDESPAANPGPERSVARNDPAELPNPDKKK